ncbi:MAG: ABC transporter ATP-binding protein [Candidatus Bathyarchaeota archaeon]|nr:ABC transporter ATP-binding protein [Candidatus Bathyarchaeum tardum]WGM89960.1 MAG: ABC transporter ATP-binding protein [Candidatus Bathyarchaeum tardum]WNZ29901.1 MAG: ABC transporter ATP-binding protein [Candidatus Bathyarchaeota archaeon]
MSVIEVENLTKKFGSFVAVNHLNFSIGEGEVFGLLGPNGAGKTTTIRMLAGLISSSEGSAKVKGYVINNDSLKVRETVGILTENPSLYEKLTAYENLDFFAQAYGLTEIVQKTQRIQELLEFFGLWERRNDKVATFSKGMKQKLALARALVHKPSIIFLDEPTSGLDPESSKEVRDLIAKLSYHEKSTILLCTHHLEDAEKLCSRVMIINKGTSVIVGTPDELRNKISGIPTVEVILETISPKLVKATKKVNDVKQVTVDEESCKLTITMENAQSGTPKIVKNLVEAEGLILGVKVVRASLEDVYLKLIKEEQK